MRKLINNAFLISMNQSKYSINKQDDDNGKHERSSEIQNQDSVLFIKNNL